MKERTADATSSPRMRGEPQPQLGPSVSASSNEVSSPASSTAPSGSSRDSVFTGDSGTKRQTRIAATPTAAAPTMKSHRHESWSINTPESTRPSPPPTPRIAETIPTP
jgi:hypothetical protein